MAQNGRLIAPVGADEARNRDSRREPGRVPKH